MWARRVRSSGRRSAVGVRSVRRDSYFTVNGMNTSSGWWDLCKLVAVRSGGRCESRTNGCRCTAKAAEVHHIRKLSDGGRNVLSNLIHLCKPCHDRRHNHLYRTRRGRG